MLLKILFSYLIFAVSLFLSAEGITGGTILSSTEIATNIYGIGAFQATNGKTCLCVWVLKSFCFLLVEGCGRFDNPEDNKMLTIMGKEYKAAPGSPTLITCPEYTTSYQRIFLSQEVLVAERPPSPETAPDFAHATPPGGTECQVVGFSGTNPAPNKIEVKIVDFMECKRIWTEKYMLDASLIKPERHFCAYLKKLNDPSPIIDLDSVAPIYCKQWWVTEKKFWKPFGNVDDDDEEEDEDVKTIPYTFVGFQFLIKNPQDVPTVFESVYCS